MRDQTFVVRIRRSVVDGIHRDWPSTLGDALHANQTTPHSTTGCTPEEIWSGNGQVWAPVRHKMIAAPEKAYQTLKSHNGVYNKGGRLCCVIVDA